MIPKEEDEIGPEQEERLSLWKAALARAEEEKAAQRRQFEAGYGPFVKGEYEIGSRLFYRCASGGLHMGRVLWSFGPGELPVSKQKHPLRYLVTSEREGWPPVEVESGQILEG